jgi:hypothetical protein
VGDSGRSATKLKGENMFGINHADGSSEMNPPVERLSDLYDELLSSTPEHGDVAVINQDNAWGISAHRDGRVVLENLALAGKDTPRHMIPVSKQRVLTLWRLLIDGKSDEILAEPWKTGYT